MKRSTPLKRTGFKSKLPPRREAKQIDYTPRPRLVVVGAPAANSSTFNPQPKAAPIQHAGYMAAVRTLACARCGWFRKGSIQFCHADEGKGLALKTDCRLGWPGCGPHDGLPGCHWIVGTSGKLSKAERREFEANASASTRASIRSSGRWPARLPAWPADKARTGEVNG
jgi:hypothetical protein